jgi:hypothetical protein
MNYKHRKFEENFEKNNGQYSASPILTIQYIDYLIIDYPNSFSAFTSTSSSAVNV